MNNHVRIASLALACALVFSLAAAPVSAAPEPTDAPFLYADQLDANQLRLFERLALLDGPEDAGVVEIRLPEPIVYRADATGESRKADRAVSQIGQGALDALLFDDPSKIWIDKSRCVTSTGAQGTGNDDGDWTWKISKLSIEIAAAPDAARMQRELEAALFDARGATRYDQVKYLHDELCRRVEYVETANCHSPYGALVEGRAVCEGYAKAFKMLCDRAGIPCVIVAGHGVTSKTGDEGENHMWNYVQMEDGKWYAVDATWDDQKDRICRDFFLVGAVTLSTKSFGSTMFSVSHVPDGDFSRSGVVFEYPPLSQRMYRPAA